MSASTFHLPVARTLSIALGLTALASSAGASLTFQDGTFLDSDWTMQTFTTASGTASSAQASQVASGGNGGSYRSVTHQMVVSGPYALILSVHLSQSAFWDPSTQGGFASINYTEDSLNIQALMGTGLAILQDGKHYLLRNPGLLYTQSSWGTTSRTGIVASDMYLIDSNGNLDASQNPNFSASGGVMQFGFWRGNGSGSTSSGTYTYQVGIDNWGVGIVVPSPGALALVGMAAMLVSRRRD